MSLCLFSTTLTASAVLMGGSDFYDYVVYRLNDRKSLLVHTGNDLADVLQTMNLIAGIGTLGRVADLEIHAALHA